MKHASDAILGDLQKLNPVIRANVKRVSSADTKSTTILGANRPAPVRDWVRKIGAHRNVSRPDPQAAARTGSTKPPADWPSNPARLESGLAVRGSLGSQPSKVGPSK
jgi:hypothetical protein